VASGLMSTRVGPPSSSSVCCEQCTQDGTLIANCSFGCTWKAEERALKLQMRRLRSSCFRLVASSGDANSEERQIATQLDGNPRSLGEQFSWNTEQSGGADCRTREEATVGGLDGLVALVLTVEAVVVRRHTGAGSEASARRLQRSPRWVKPVGSLGKERCTVARAHQSIQSMRAFDAPWYKTRRGFVRFGTSCAFDVHPHASFWIDAREHKR
jgi:hypothetical protein